MLQRENYFQLSVFMSEHEKRPTDEEMCSFGNFIRAKATPTLKHQRRRLHGAFLYPMSSRSELVSLYDAWVKEGKNFRTTMKPKTKFQLRVFMRNHTNRTPKEKDLASFGRFLYRNGSKSLRESRTRSHNVYQYPPEAWDELVSLYDLWLSENTLR